MTLERSLTGPVGLPLFGSLFAFRSDPLGFLESVARKHGDIARFHVGRETIFALSHPDLIEELLIGHKEVLVKGARTAALSSVVGEGLLTSEGERWKAQRRRVAPSFQPRHLAAYGAIMADVARGRCPKPGEHDVHALMTEVTLEIVVKTLFGTDLAASEARSDQVGPLLADLMEDFEHEFRTIWRFLPSFLPASHRSRSRRSTALLDEMVLSLVTARRRAPEGDDLLSRLMSARDEDGSCMDDQSLRDEAVTIFLAGHETTALLLSYALWQLSESPEALQRALTEVDALGRDPTAEDVHQLPQIDAILRETLRLYPPAWAFGREPTATIEIAGHSIPEGSQIVVSPWVVHRDPRFWPDPLAFRPERWLQAAERPRFAYFPFGGGPRICVGNHFAMMEAAIVLATWLRRRKPVSAGQPPILVPAVTLRPREGLPLRLEAR